MNNPRKEERRTSGVEWWCPKCQHYTPAELATCYRCGVEIAAAEPGVDQAVRVRNTSDEPRPVVLPSMKMPGSSS